MARKDVTPAEIEAAYQDLRARFPVVSEADQLAATVVVLPGLGLRGWSGWLCKVCRRQPLPNQQPWSWYGCQACRAVDQRAAALFGGKRILPLGQHSIMNGIGIRLSTPRAPASRRSSSSSSRSVADGRTSTRGPRSRESGSSRPPRGLGIGQAESVPLPTWQEWFPPSRQASADAFTRLIALQQPWLIDMESKVADVAWLAGGMR